MMKTYMTRLFSVLMLTMVSMGAWADVDVQITNDGKFDGGTIKYVGQTKPDEKGFVTVTISVAPDKDYTIKKNNITVVSTYPPSDPNARTRTPEIAENLTLYFKGSADADTDDPSAEREYTFNVPSGFGAWVKEAEFQKKDDDSKGGGNRSVPFVPTTEEDITKNTQKYYLIQSIDRPTFYAIPNSSDDEAKVSTTSIPNANMRWCFVDAGSDSDHQYYYIVNSTGRCLYRNNDSNDGILIKKTYADLSSLSDDELTKYKFCLTQTGSDYFIQPKGFPGQYLNKRGGNTNYSNNYYIKSSTYNDSPSVWNFVAVADISWPQPFTPSVGSDKHFYKFQNKKSPLYYLSILEEWATVNSADNNKNVWYLVEAGTDATYSSSHYYFIVNVSTGKYLYYTGGTGNDVAKIMDYNASDADKYKFLVVDAACKPDNTNYETCYTIVPKLRQTNYNNKTSFAPMAVSDDSHLLLKSNRSSSGYDANWVFVATEYSTKCDDPTIIYSSATGKISITTTTTEATIHYTLDGTTAPSSSVGTLYEGPFDVTGPITIKAIATKTGSPDSEVTTVTFDQVATPTIQINGSNAVSITCGTEGAAIYYTLDGSTPTTSSTPYTEPLTENVSGVTIKAIAVKEGMINSAIASNSFTLQCAKPVFTKNGNNLTITCVFPSNASIYYTLDSSEPSSSSTLYEGAFTVALHNVIKAIAIAPGYDNSLVATKTIHDDLSPNDDGKYLINSQTDFETFVDMANEEEGASYHYVLKNNVDAGSEISQPFTGIFEADADEKGNFYKISGLEHPLFNTVNGGTVKNIMLKDVKIAQDGPVGAIAGIAKGYSRIYNCGILPSNNKYIAKDETSYVNSNGGDNRYCGGIVGWLQDDSRVINCFSFANVTGGSEEAGIVGYNAVASNTTKTDNKYANLNTMVMNCMFYADISGGGTIHPVYGGQKIDNNAANGINNYNYFRANRYEYDKEEDKYVDIDDVTFDDGFSIDQYFCSWPAEAEYLTRFEYYRSILNGNRPLAGWWVKSDVAPSRMEANDVQTIDKDASLMAKWVLDPAIAPYPILKKFDKYSSIVNPNQDKVWNAESNDWIDRTTAAKPFEGKNLGSVEVTIYGGDFSNSKTEYLTLQVLDMDTLNHDYCYAKVQLPYYNKVFGNPNGDTWEKKYASNYTTKVVTGWNITSATGTSSTAGSFKGAASIKGATNSTNSTPDDTTGNPWEDGYDFADRNCTNKDLFQKSGRVFAQGGYYYVPVGVTNITIEAHWAAARYVCNADNSYDRIMVGATHFEPAGTIPTTFQGQKVWTSITNAIKNTDANAQTFSNVGEGKTVYDQAIVLIGNMQLCNKSTIVGKKGDEAIPFTLMSADFDFDNEPDYCLDLQYRETIDRPGVQPIRFDFLPVPDLGLAVKVDKFGYSIGVMVPFGHFEITETAFMHTTQFEYDGPSKGDNKMVAPLILNGGHFEQIVMRYGGRKTEYILMGGHFRMSRFTPGSHANGDSQKNTRHCAVNAIGGEYPEFYLSGYYRTDPNPTADNPHCYINGGKFNKIAGAGVEKINGSVTFKIDHALIREFYGGGINAGNPISGSINVTINNSRVDKYCGGPQVGDMSPNSTITTTATGTTFREYYGGGNGGTSYFRDQQTDGETTMPTSASDWTGLSGFSPLGKYDSGKGYHALYEFELFNSSNGLDEKVVKRAYYQWARFAKTQTGSVTNTLTDCILLGDYYGAGNLAAVGGTTEASVDLGNCSVVSTLTNTSVAGSAFGGGYSASIPSFLVHDKSTVHIPERDDAGIITEGKIDYQKDNDLTNDGSIYKYFRWTHSVDDLPAGVTLKSTSTSSPTFLGEDGKYYCYTDKPLTNLGTVTGMTSLTIEGNSTIGGNVFGGGNESAVSGNTNVTLKGNATVNGNVFGGGNVAEVSGSATVNIQD